MPFDQLDSAKFTDERQAVAAALAAKPLSLEDRQAVLDDPVRTVIGMFALTHQLGFFNILPLLAVALSGVPGVVALLGDPHGARGPGDRPR